nr:unnamed protein product [Callosobruchus chinensis]
MILMIFSYPKSPKPSKLMAK